MSYFNRPRPGGSPCWQAPPSDIEAAETAFDRNADMSLQEALARLKDIGSSSSSPENYGAALAAVSVVGSQDLLRRDGKGGEKTRTGYQILRAQAAHYPWLRNHALRLASLSEQDRRMFSCGTASNEALHREMGSLNAGVHRQSLELIRCKLAVKLWSKLGSALLRKHPTAGKPQSRLVSSISALVRIDEQPLLLEVVGEDEKKTPPGAEKSGHGSRAPHPGGPRQKARGCGGEAGDSVF